MSDTVGAILVAAVIIALLGPIFVWMVMDAFDAAREMWRDLKGRRS